jgi:hypothetical protein
LDRILHSKDAIEFRAFAPLEALACLCPMAFLSRVPFSYGWHCKIRSNTEGTHEGCSLIAATGKFGTVLGFEQIYLEPFMSLDPELGHRFESQPFMSLDPELGHRFESQPLMSLDPELGHRFESQPFALAGVAPILVPVRRHPWCLTP